MATSRQVTSEQNFEVFETNTTLPTQRLESKSSQVPASDDTTSNSTISTTVSTELLSSCSKTSTSTLVKSIKTESVLTNSTILDLDDLDFPTTPPPQAPPQVPPPESEQKSYYTPAVKGEYRTRIRTIEELLDSSSDLDLPVSPPPPPPTTSATVLSTPEPSAPSTETMSANKNDFPNKNCASSECCVSKVPNDCNQLASTSTTNLVNDRSASVSPTPTSATTIASPGGISTNHYERLIEELKCPGCASPMKAPIKLCATGHSICQHCTTVLLLCPLCKAPFIDLRSLTLEALCSKAHFRCSNAAAGCTVRLQIDLLNWHEKQCVWKSMKCFMGRVWGDCTWTGREAGWKEHLESTHSDKLFTTNEAHLVWNLNGKVKSLAGYYVFEVYDEMFNFYQVYDKDRILFTMTVASTVRDRKFNFAYEVEMFHKDNEALVITQRFPVHSEYDKDILLDGTCVCVNLNDLTRFFDREKNLHFRVRIHEVRSPKKSKAPRKPCRKHPIDFQQTDIEGANLKSVPAGVIVTRQLDDIPLDHANNEEKDSMKNEDTSSDEDPEFEAFIEKNWSTPQMNFNRKYLRSGMSKDSSLSSGSSSLSATTDGTTNSLQRQPCEAGGTKSKMQNVTSSLRKSFRSLRTDIIELKKPFTKKSPEKKESLIKK